MNQQQAQVAARETSTYRLIKEKRDQVLALQTEIQKLESEIREIATADAGSIFVAAVELDDRLTKNS